MISIINKLKQNTTKTFVTSKSDDTPKQGVNPQKLLEIFNKLRKDKEELYDKAF